MLTRRELLGTAAAAAAAGVLAPGAQAARTGELNILCWEGYNSAQVLDPFRAMKTANVRAESLTNDPTMINRLRAGETNVWDLINVNNPWARKIMAPEKLIKPLDRARMEPYFDKMLPAFKPPYRWAMSDDGSELLGMAQRFGPYSFVVNTDKISRAAAEDQGWDLWNDAAMAGRYGILESDDWNVFNIFVIAGIDPFTEHSEADLTKFSETAKRVFGGAKLVGDIASMNQALVSGEIDLHLTGGTYSVSPARADGHPELRGITPNRGPMERQGRHRLDRDHLDGRQPRPVAAGRAVPRIRAAARDGAYRRLRRGHLQSGGPDGQSQVLRALLARGAGRDPVGQPRGGDEPVGRVRYRARLRQGARPDDGGQAGARLTALASVAAARPILQLVGVSRTFGELAAVDRVDLEVREGEFFTVVGPSGSGKTTLLRMLAGMETPSDGDILLRGTRINDLPANRRPTCLVFQSLALFPHRSVGQNIEFPLKMKGVAAGVRRERAQELMRMVRLPEDYYGKNVTKCSGGERQRVALARAFAYDPEILFFDEPLSAIDYKLRKVLERELKDIHKETGKTFMYITHSLEEAMVMSDRIGVMRSGRLVQVGTPEDIYNRPADRFVSEFMGDVNVITVMPNGNGSFEGVDVPGHFRAPVTATRARLPGDPAGVPTLRRDQGRGRQRDRRHGLQRVFAGLAHAVPGPRRRQGVRGRALAPRRLARRPRPAGAARLGRRRRHLRAGLTDVVSPRAATARGPLCRAGAAAPGAWASPHRWSRSPPTPSRRRAASRCSAASRSPTTPRSSTLPTRSGPRSPGPWRWRLPPSCCWP